MIDICTVTWNRKICIERLINTFSQRSGEQPHRFVITDNGSEDDTAEYLSSLTGGTQITSSNVEVIRNEKKLPVAQAFNQAIERFVDGNSEYMFLCHSDLVYGNAIGSRDPLDVLASAVSDVLSPLSDRIQLHLKLPKSKRLVDKVKDTFQFNSVAVMIARNVVETVGFFDPVYEFFFYDMDYSRRALEKGFKIQLHRGVFFPHPANETPHIECGGFIKEAFISQVEAEQLAAKDSEYYNKKWHIVDAVRNAECGMRN
jgi:GT2 family glycosyltransferase